MDLELPEVAGPLGTLAFSLVQPHSSTASLRAVKWHADLTRLGIDIPFAVVHDVGLALCLNPDQLDIRPRASVDAIDAALTSAIPGYENILREVRASEAARRSVQLQMSDDLITVVLARVLGDVARSVAAKPAYRADLPLDGAMFERLDPNRLAHLYRALSREFERHTLTALDREKLLVLTMTDALDLDTLQLFGMVGVAAGGALAQVELLASLETPEANDVVNFSLEILPAVLETKVRHGGSTFAAFGYSGLGRRGSIDNMVLTELAWDDAELARRVLDNEVLYYAREQQREEEGREHLLLIDASASMRGERATFARAIALATGKKLLLEGEDVTVRFFDARLYEPHRAVEQQMPTAHLLSFTGERGRNPARVFEALIRVLDVTRAEDAPVIHVFTHAALYIPRELVTQVRARAQMTCVFMLPSGGRLALDYLDLLNAHWAVDHAMLSGNKRAGAAREILAEVVPSYAETKSTTAASETGVTTPL